jgi:regulator of cell morphogenesis and NO signaling
MDTDTLMKDIALGHPACARVLDALPLNYCCDGGGRLSLAEASLAAGLDAAAVLARLEQAQIQAPAAEPRRDTSSATALIRHLLATHHAFTRAELARLETLLDKLVNRHAEARPELKAIQACFLALRDDLLPHLKKEEIILFPYIEALQQHRLEGGPMPAACFGTLANPLRQMESEHQAVGGLLKQLRQTTRDYAPPPDVCSSYRVALQALEGLEADLLRHIRLENDVLFPQARELAATA